MHGPSGTPGSACTAEDLGARSALAHWLSGVLAGDIGPVPSSLPAGRWPTGLAAAIQRVRAAPSESAKRESERVRLFVNAPGGIPAPPYGSWWIERRMQGETSAQVADCYRTEGLRTEAGSGAADYLPVELEFVHFLLQHQRAARLTGESKLESEAAARENEFLQRFVLSWLGEFRSAVTSATADPFWPALVDLVDAFVTDESRRVGVSDRPGGSTHR